MIPYESLGTGGIKEGGDLKQLGLRIFFFAARSDDVQNPSLCVRVFFIYSVRRSIPFLDRPFSVDGSFFF